MKKNILLFLLAFLPLLASAFGDAAIINGLTFDYFDWNGQGTCRFAGDFSVDPMSSAYTGKIIVPSTVQHNGKTYTVTQMGDYAFLRSTVTSVYIPNSVTTIGDNAFNGCSTLTTILADMQNPPTSKENWNLDASCALIVPIGKKSTYNSQGWTTEIFTGGVYENALIKVDDKTMTYGDPKPTLTFTSASLEVFKNNPHLYSPCSSTSPVGEYYIEVDNKANVLESGYVTFLDGKMTITKAPLMVTAKSYTIAQGDPIPTFEATFSGFKNGQTSSVLSKQPTFSCSATSSSGAGTYNIIVSGASAQNYEMTYVNGTLTITGDQTISLSTLPTMTYGDAAYTLPSQTIQGQTLTWSVGNTSVASVSENTLTIKGAGSTTVTATAQGNSLYNDFTKSYTLTVNKTPLTITAKSYTITEGDPIPTFEATYDGFKNGETQSVLTTQPTFYCTATSSSIPGTYEIIVSGAAAKNYSFTYVKGTLTVEQITGNTLTGTGTASNPFIIANAQDWATFAANVNAGINADKYYKLADDFDNATSPVTDMVGTAEIYDIYDHAINPFKGHFDGNNKALYVNINGNVQGTAPFSCIEGATIENLNVVGTVRCSERHAAGLVGFCAGESQISILNCHVTVDVDGGGSNFAGGIVGHGLSSTLTMNGCVYIGQISGFIEWGGGLMGWSDSMFLYMDNCLFKGSFIPSGGGVYHPVALTCGESSSMVTNVYFINTTAPTAYFCILPEADGIPVSETLIAGEWDNPVVAADGNTYYTYTGQTPPNPDEGERVLTDSFIIGDYLYENYDNSSTVEVSCANKNITFIHVDCIENVSHNGKTYVVNTFAKDAFKDCKKLVAIWLREPYLLKSGAFVGCDNLKTIELEIETPPLLSDMSNSGSIEDVFDTHHLQDVTIIVHENKSQYVENNEWNKFNHIITRDYYGNEFQGKALVDDVEQDINCKVYSEENKWTQIGYWTPGSQNWWERAMDTSMPGVLKIPEYVKNNGKTYTVIIIGASSLRYSSFDEVVIPNSVFAVASESFQDCLSLQKVSLGTGMTFLDGTAFAGCNNLRDIYVYATTPPGISYHEENAVFDGIPSDCVLHVPAGCAEAYRTACGWRLFNNIVEIAPLFDQDCAMPTISYVDGKLVFDCDTEGATFKSSITCEDIAEHESSEIDLSVTYNVSVYAVADGYNNSDVATVTLCWIDTKPAQGTTTDMKDYKTPVLLKSRDGIITVEGLANGTQVSFYTADGMSVGSATTFNGIATFNSSLASGTVLLVKMGQKTVKLVVK